MKQPIIYLMLICLFFSCEEKTSYRMRIFIKNETDKNLSVTVFPKLKYLDGNLYDNSAIGGGLHETTFEITPGLNEDLYTTGDLKIQPYHLTAQVFDSIQINLPEGYINTIKFSPDTVIGYTKNLYKETSHWVYEIKNENLQTSFQRNPVESHDYSFVISKDNFVQGMNYGLLRQTNCIAKQ